MKDIRALYVFLKMRSDTEDFDAATVDALRSKNLRWFTHVFLNVPSWQERSSAVEHPLVKHAVNLCKDQGVSVVWGRWLWVAWSDDPQRFANAHADPAFYANAIVTVREDARQLGAVGSLLDVEPYGNSAQKAIKKIDLRDVVREQIEAAVASAVDVAGPVDYLTPTASTRQRSFVWPLTGLGRNRCDPKSYYNKPPDYKINANPPDTHKHLVHLWGSAVKATSEGNDNRLVPSEVQAIDLDEVRKLYPECVGGWVYVDPKDLPTVLDKWGAV